MTGGKPKQLLTDHELMGFTQRLGDGSQVVRRASSAKVTKPDDPARVAAPIAAKTPPESSDA
jgi:hypothetical protein